MPTEVIMPKVDMDMATGVIAAWHAADGARVEKGAPLFDIETDKAAMEVEAPATGTLRILSTEDGAAVAIGAPVAWIYADGEEAANPPAQLAPVVPAGDSPVADAAVADATPPSRSEATSDGDADGRWRATPVARRLAEQEGVPLSAISGSGPRGRVQRADVLRHVERQRMADQRPLSAPEPAALRDGPPASDPRHGAPAPAAQPARDDTAAASLPVVTIHGFLADAGSWEALRRRLPRGTILEHLELPNHGRGERRRIADFNELAGTVLAAFDARGGEPCHLLGHSLGAAVALAVADRRPDAVAALTLLCPAGLGPEIDGSVLAGLAAATRARSLAPWLKTLVHDPEAISWNYVEAAAAARADPLLREAQAAMAEALFPDGTQALDVGAALGRVACPTRIVWGRQDRIIPWRHALRAPGRVALHLFDRVGHLPQLEAADELAALIPGRA